MSRKLTDEELDAQASAGDLTLRMEAESGVRYVPHNPIEMTREDLTKALLAKAGGLANLLTAMGELYALAAKLDDFLARRVGPTEDWPLIVCGDEYHLAELDRIHEQFHEMISALAPERQTGLDASRPD